MSQPLSNGSNLRLLASVLSSFEGLSVTSVATKLTTLQASSSATRPCKRHTARGLDLKTRRLPYTAIPRRPFSTTSRRRHDPQANAAKPFSSSVNATEVSHFSELASEWWDPQGSSRLLHLMNPLRHDFISECLSSNPSYAADSEAKYNYLDVGCGGGIFAESAARLPNASSVTAIDPTPGVIEIANAHSRNDPALGRKLTYINTSIEELSTHIQRSNSSSEISTDAVPQFDIITLFEVIEHITHPSPFLRNVLTHLRPGGWLILSTISRHPVSYLTTKLIGEMPVFGLVPPGTHTWSQYIRPDELQEWFQKEENGRYELMKTKGVAYVPGLGWNWTPEGWGLETWGNYFFAVKKAEE